MKTSTAHRLLRLNRHFYRGFANEFSETRKLIQPGILLALGSLGNYSSLLDLGCGDGRVLTVIRPAFKGVYQGVDCSSELLAIANTYSHPSVSFLRADLATSGWSHQCNNMFDAAVCLSVLHHIPGHRRRLRMLCETKALVSTGGRFAISVWRFRHVPRLLKKTVPWEDIGIDASAVESGDYLVDWRRGGHGLRYVHHFYETELADLCESAGFSVIRTYRSDGKTGDMGLYIICEA